MNFLHDQHILILGLGASGLALARWCVRMGARVTVADTREAPPQQATLAAELPQVRLVCGPLHEGLVQGTDVRAVFKSPGLTPASVAPVWSAAVAMGLWVGGELDVFARSLAELLSTQSYQPKILAITGTNGKTTVTSLTGLLVERAGLSVAVAGNIGPTLLDTLAERLDADQLPQVWVLELSSFQLECSQGFEPTAATVLNLSQDHLDWHGSMQAYAQAKARIFGAHSVMVLNRGDAAVMAMADQPSAKGVAAKGRPAREMLTFGVDEPLRAGDYGLQNLNGMNWLVRAQEPDDVPRRRRAQGQASDAVVQDAAEWLMQRLMPADALRIRGQHNATNALAALALAQAAGCSLAPMLYGLREYRGEPHRVESIGLIHEVEYFDDSKATNVGATVAAIEGLGSERRLVLILGGDGKGQDFAPLAAPVARYARVVLLIGRDAAALRLALAGTGVVMQDAASLQEAVQLASTLAQSGDAVLLSPACASLDMFKNYEHRAQVFVQAVQQLAHQQGVVWEGAA
jgi:UDP-N-acetylmuramoylalanine--D-glutamate ligase